jgi:archaellum component FlaC
MPRMRNNRGFDPISLSFLDVISCGFGAVVLIFLILDHNAARQNDVTNRDTLAEIDFLNEDIREGEEGLVRLRNTLSDVDFQVVEAQGRARVIEEEIKTILEELARLENESSSKTQTEESLRDEIKSLEEELEKLRKEELQSGNNIRRFVGEGNRQYLTGLLLGGSRILILVDTSASMLDATIVNIIRRRNMNTEAKLSAPKWKRTRSTVEWLIAQLPPPSQYQIYTFNSETLPLIDGTDWQWLEVADQTQLDQAVTKLNTIVPANGTNLDKLFAKVASIDPPPDNIYLITDGLPTLGKAPVSGNISGRDRERLFNSAVRELPSGIPINIILEPLEGDPMAAPLFWQLAITSKGSFLNPAEDWP